ncbi:MAG: helix-turn-helix domain-containing protein [Blautia sp.]|jgi:DNA-binding transcriptional MerR regulator
MEDERYTVSQVESLTGIKGHVLRYWEEELELVIGRNAMGHRCYTRYDVQMFLNIKELKNRGLQLRAIKELVPRISRKGPGASTSRVKLLETEEGSDSCQETAKDAQGAQKAAYAARMREFQRILERLITQGLKEKNHEERRCRSLDEAIRIHQQTRKQAAAAYEKKGKKQHKIFSKKKRFAKSAVR